MCVRTKCSNCKKITWSGCGAHINQVMAGVPQDQKCTCKPSDRKPAGMFSRLFGR